ncbi:MAG: glutamate-5-semialdehyde dehydrogenase, partial [Candidatus Omnitrophica bacterium]|nr:glutamate-5-semialdehyde dehydrogenase [Candidatus Omnitrophota bacterium]
MNLKKEMIALAKNAQLAFRVNLGLTAKIKNKVLKEMSRSLLANKEVILKANKKDILAAYASGVSPAFIDRLSLDEKRIKEMADSMLQVARLPDPLGRSIKSWRRPNGLKINKLSVPIGTVAIIYESRPNVTAECASLCFKSGNSVILRGGSEAMNSNTAIYRILKGVLNKYGIDTGLINMVTTTDRKAVEILLKLNDYIDLVIPRGGEGLIRKVVRSSLIPVIKHYKGICHVYVDDWADLNMAQEICFNAKVQRPGVCNAMESMLVHKDTAARFLPGM